MSRLVVISSILIVIVSLGITSIVYLSNTKNTMEPLLSELLYSCINQSDDNNMQKAEKLSTFWEARQSILGFFVKHEQLDSIGGMLSDLISQLEIGSYDGAYSQANRIIFSLDHIVKKEIPSLDNLI